ncbi:hypothetical protein Lal_00028311 [Lupinus albus]|nr:hypothetical protein Lal_00028311 [Lupinus albus]
MVLFKAILASTIRIIDQINDYFRSQNSGDEKEYIDSYEDDISEANESGIFNILTPQFLNSLATFGLPKHKIKLKMDTPVILLRNLDQPKGVCNVTRLVVTKMANYVLETKIMFWKKKIGNTIYIPNDNQ